VTLLLAATDANNNDDNNNTPPSKPKSRLARLAEDWLEEEEEGDELTKYWERFDKKEKQEPTTVVVVVEKEEENNLSTEQRLERYYDRRGINKKKEEEHATSIQEAIQTAQKAATSEQAIAALQKVRPWLQVNTRLGGTALVELAIALWQKDEEEEALLLCQELLSSPHVKAKVKKLIQNGPSKRQSDSSSWQGLLDGNTSWW
jgi:hypothetical protein